MGLPDILRALDVNGAPLPWSLEKRNRPSKWVTLDGERLLRRIGAGMAEETG
jgi:hypothetical protein